MKDYSHIPHMSRILSHQVFIARNTGDTADWQPWTKPRNCKMVFILCVGPGGGGGAGQSAASNVNRGGGAGGAGGAWSTWLIPSILLPDTLLVHCPRGGAGGAAGAGTGASRVFVTTAQNFLSGSAGINPNELIATSGTGNVSGGGLGTAAGTAGPAGPGQIVVSTNSCLGMSMGFWTGGPSVGPAGGAGGPSTGAGGNVVWGTNGQPSSGGAGGGGTNTVAADQAGGNITGAGRVATLTGGAAGGGAGQSGLYYGAAGGIAIADLDAIMSIGGYGLFGFTGGSGGGAKGAALQVGGAGGDGAYGCGGGGGGAGVTGGAGGRGGDGLCLFMTW